MSGISIVSPIGRSPDTLPKKSTASGKSVISVISPVGRGYFPYGASED